METVLITGTSSGVGKAAAKKFLREGLKVIGLDWKERSIIHSNYEHYVCDVSDYNSLPNLTEVNYIINNAGIVTPKKDAIRVNQIGYINIIKKYGDIPGLKSILMIGSTASEKGYNNIECCSSQGARNSIMKWAAINLGRDRRHVLVNSLNLDSVQPASGLGEDGSGLEPTLYEDNNLVNYLKRLSVLERLTRATEIADWIYFLTVVNTCVTGQIINVDGEIQGCHSYMEYPGWND